MKRPKIGVFTTAAKNYLAHVRTLMSSLSAIHPDYELYFCLADEPNGCFSPETLPFKTIQASTLGIPNYADLSVRYNALEFCTALKPWMFKWLFDNTDLDAIVYLDPDIKVYSGFGHLEMLIKDGVELVLTPHITRPLGDHGNPNDHVILKSGIYNLGFIALTRTDRTLEFLDWWGEKLRTKGSAEFAKNEFTDQLWCNLAPCFVDRFHSLNDPCWNIAYWNIEQRSLTRGSDHIWLVDDRPLVFFHFSGFDAQTPDRMSKFQNRIDLEEMDTLRTIFADYAQELLANGLDACTRWPYSRSKTKDGFEIPEIVRRFYRSEFDAPQELDLDTVGDFLLRLCNRKHDLPLETPVSSLMYFIFKEDENVRTPLKYPQNPVRRSVEWFFDKAATKYNLPEAVLPDAFNLAANKPTSQDEEGLGGERIEAAETGEERSTLAASLQRLGHRLVSLVGAK